MNRVQVISVIDSLYFLCDCSSDCRTLCTVVSAWTVSNRSPAPATPFVLLYPCTVRLCVCVCLCHHSVCESISAQQELSSGFWKSCLKQSIAKAGERARARANRRCLCGVFFFLPPPPPPPPPTFHVPPPLFKSRPPTKTPRNAHAMRTSISQLFSAATDHDARGMRPSAPASAAATATGCTNGFAGAFLVLIW